MRETKEQEPGRARRGARWFRLAFVPALLSLSAACWIERDGLEPLLSASSLRIDYTSALLLLSILAICLAERLYPANREWRYRLFSDGARGWARLGRDLVYLLFIAQVSALLIKRTASWLHSAGLGGFPFALWPARLPFGCKVVLAFLLVEFSSYWLHRACHRFPLLWQFHSTHHVVTELSGLKSLRTHPIDNVFFYLARTAPLLALGAGPDELVAVTYFGSVLGLLAHANIEVSEGYWGLVINFPRYHSVHHSADPLESKSNFGCHTVLWDRLFGTFRSAPSGALRVGVEPLGARSLWQELAWPFYRSLN